MLVAAKVDPENPWRAANVINEHPGVSHNYLRNHEFNIWFTIATEPDSPLGLEGTLEVLARIAGAESIRQLPTLKLFKIRMDLEMEGDTDALAKSVEVAPPAETERQPYDEFDIAVIRATQGDMPVLPEPYAPAAAALGVTQERLLAHLEAMRERRCFGASPRSCSTAAPGSAPTGWASGTSPKSESWSSGRKWPRSVGSRTATSGRPTPIGRTRFSRWPMVVRRRSATRSSRRSPPRPGSPIARPSTPRPSSRRSGCCTSPSDYRDWEREHAGA